jgi:shikimate dehydrogenase
MIITGKTKVYGLIGDPVKNSFSPHIYNEAFKLKEIDSKYLVFNTKPDNLESAIDGIKSLGISGLNITTPFKEKVISYVSSQSEAAKLMGTINTVINNDGDLNGYNTDYAGFLNILCKTKTLYDIDKPLNIALLGAGGAARAVLFSLLLFYRYLTKLTVKDYVELKDLTDIKLTLDRTINRIFIFNRNHDRALKLVNMTQNLINGDKIPISIHPLSSIEIVEIVNTCDMVINTTPLGFIDGENFDNDILDNLFRKDQIVIDFVYNPIETSFIKKSKEKKAQVIYGIDLLLNQAYVSFLFFTGETFSIEQVKANILKSIKN